MSDLVPHPPRPNGIEHFATSTSAALARLKRGVAPLARMIAEWNDRASEALRPMQDWVREHGPRVVEVIAQVQRFGAEAHVENWAELEEHEWVAALRLMRDDDGVPLAWVPPAHVVKRLVNAVDHDARDVVLLAHAAEISGDARRVLTDVADPSLRDLRIRCEQGWDAWNAGHSSAAQALAAACVTDVIERQLPSTFGTFRRDVDTWRDRHPETWGLTSYRVTAVKCSLSTAVQRVDPDHPRFNRHATAHGVHPCQYTPANALHGLMLATSAIREQQFLVAREWLSTPAFTAPRGTTAVLRAGASHVPVAPADAATPSSTGSFASLLDAAQPTQGQ